MFLRLGLTLALAACHVAPCDAAADREADIRGRVTHVRPADDAGGRRDYLGSILVEGAGRYEKVNIAVRRGTTLSRVREGQRRPARFADLRVGDSVRVWFDGPVMESYPAQATAREVVIVGDEERGGSSRPNVSPGRVGRNTPRAASVHSGNRRRGRTFYGYTRAAYRPATARLAEKRTLRFLERHLR